MVDINMKGLSDVSVNGPDITLKDGRPSLEVSKEFEAFHASYNDLPSELKSHVAKSLTQDGTGLERFDNLTNLRMANRSSNIAVMSDPEIRRDYQQLGRDTANQRGERFVANDMPPHEAVCRSGMTEREAIDRLLAQGANKVFDNNANARAPFLVQQHGMTNPDDINRLLYRGAIRDLSPEMSKEKQLQRAINYFRGVPDDSFREAAGRALQANGLPITPDTLARLLPDDPNALNSQFHLGRLVQ